MNDLTKKEKIALEILNGLLSRSINYDLRQEYRGLDWHHAIVSEAFDLTDNFIIESSKRRL
jgi:hypothetical protein